MRIAEVIGTVTRSRPHPTLMGLRLVIGVPFSLRALRENVPPDGEDLVMVDVLNAGSGSRVGFSEGGEAAVPFLPQRKPIDAYCAFILYKLVVSEAKY